MKRKYAGIRIRTAAVCAAAAVLAGGCGTARQTAAEAPDGSQDSGPRLLGVCFASYEDPYMELYRRELRKYLLEEKGMKEDDILVAYAADDPEKQSRQLEELLGCGVDAVILDAVNEDCIPAAVDRCAQAQVPVVCVGQEPEPEEAARWETEDLAAAYVGSDRQQTGVLQGELILETRTGGDIDRDGTLSYVVLTDRGGSESARRQAESAEAVLRESGLRLRKLYEGRTGGSEEKAREEAGRAFGLFGSRVEAVICESDAMAEGARQAAQDAGYRPGKDLYLVGADGLEETVRHIKEGTVTGTVLTDYRLQSHTVADMALAMAAGDPVEREYRTEGIKIAAE